jgi:hypothetical protein
VKVSRTGRILDADRSVELPPPTIAAVIGIIG